MVSSGDLHVSSMNPAKESDSVRVRAGEGQIIRVTPEPGTVIEVKIDNNKQELVVSPKHLCEPKDTKGATFHPHPGPPRELSADEFERLVISGSLSEQRSSSK